jgi:hypothetical protein
MQSERSQFRARASVIGMQNGANSRTSRDMCEHRDAFDIDYLPGRHLGYFGRKPKDVSVRLADVDEAGGNK